MSYTDEEICKFYRNGSNISILQDLTGKNKKEIVSILEKHGYKVKVKKSPWKKYDDEGFFKHYNKGLNDTEIAKAIGCSEGTVNIWRQKNRLSSNYHKKLNKKDHSTAMDTVQ